VGGGMMDATLKENVTPRLKSDFGFKARADWLQEA